MRAEAGADVEEIAHRIGAALAGAGSPDDVDLRLAPASVLTGAEVRAAAAARAARAQAERAALRDAAVAHRAGLAARRTHLLDRADWCEANAGTARALHATLGDALAGVDAARAAVEAAAHRRERVAEQRSAAQAAVEQARLELEGLDGAALDETSVRRQIEVATTAEQEAAAALAEAEAEVADLQARLDAVESTAAALAAERDIAAEEHAAVAADADLEAAVADALAFHDELADGALLDAGAAALADAIDRVERQLGALERGAPRPPSAEELRAAEEDVVVARRNLDAARAASSSFEGPPPPWWDHITALHAEVADAEAALQTAGLRRGSAQKRYENALAAERARLDELGFESYLDVLLSGGRLPHERTSENLAIAHATDALAGAERRLDQLHALVRDAAPVTELLEQRAELVAAAAELLGCDPGDRAAELLATHPAVPPMALAELAAALRLAGIDATGVGLAAAARAWLAERAARQDPDRLASIDRRLDESADERLRLEQALSPARARVERAAAAHAAAARTVASLDAELRARAGEDGRLLERATAARALREQVEAVERRLADAESEALEAWAATGEALAAAEAELERVQRDLADLERRASRAAADLPEDRRPPVDLVSGLAPLAAALRAEAAALADPLAAAEAAAVAAVHEAGEGPGVPNAADVVGAIDDVLAALELPAGLPIVWAEPLGEVGAAAAEPGLAAIADASAARPTVVVTGDLTVVGWAIGLPADVGALVPARSLDHLVPATPATHQPVVD